MANQYTKMTRENILRKVNRKQNPVTSIAQLAREFGHNTRYYRWDEMALSGTAASGAFRNRVKTLVGEKVYNQIRHGASINRAYR